MTTPTRSIYESPLREGLSALRHWGFVWDYDDGPGGFVSGQFLLRSDGVLLRRYGYSRSNFETGTTWIYKEWQVFDAGAGTDVAKVSGRLRGEGYSLNKPDPCPIDQSAAGPFPGVPDLAQRAEDLT